jgi:Ca2+-transporting ATPase
MIIRRIELAAMFFIAGNMGELLYIILAMVFGLPILTPLQILFINIITDAVPALALSFAPVHVGHKKAVQKDLLGRHEYTYIAITAILVSMFAVYGSWLYRQNPSLARGTVFLLIIIMQQIMLIDIWLGLVKRVQDFKKILHTSMLLAVGSMMLVLVGTHSIPFTREYFDINSVNASSLTLIAYGVAAYFLYVFLRITYKKTQTNA